ncbi:hypothetical protein WN66_04154 [Saccharomyces cerevisiae]|uniref:Putative uncharacterized protein YLL019W-A n=2 Tax=Saccharomyces cerevisiae TaxID=4932 RepID=YL019_YEAST|nr:RecName: Full=Putative uncharacterized protein YLL019W-A [Saccharomyces cerevisiae S288C]AAL79275.1 unknown [Saccharomyces cerevisiae]KZV09229.1 hypothetical protein WN66_04154 [Saccharomyces cerevisiae]WNV72678.1 hypothetical protein O6U65_1535 [Saccharomyces cerevisiae synthetic construct]CAY81220.1 EC1118_1L10_0485p [Saccharomyces cerevisiae EC1118]
MHLSTLPNVPWPNRSFTTKRPPLPNMSFSW